MINKTKIGDCSTDGCNSQNTNCVKVGKKLFCLKCRSKQKTEDQIKKQLLRKKEYCVFAKPPSSKKSVIEDLDEVVSKIVRMKYANTKGIVDCYTCSWSGNWKHLDCGHFISRSKLWLRWDFRNLRPQCKKCNQMLYGNVAVFSEKLNDEFPGVVDQLIEESKFIYKPGETELKELLISMREKLKIINIKFE